MNVIKANEEHIDDVAKLFDLYRQFYECPPDLDLATTYINDRIKNQESTIFVAMDNQENAAGFVQLYPSFCSVDAVKIQILYDLYVSSDYRKQGVGEMLMYRATEFADESGAARLDLLTAKTNCPGQRLYEKLGYKKTNEDFFAYSLSL